MRVTLANVRNYATLEFEPAPGLNLFVGSNAQGKSNLLEAIGMLAIGKSFRTSREAEIVREGEGLASFGAEAEIAAGRIGLSCSITVSGKAARKIYGINGRHVRYASYLGRVRVVTFTPDDLRLIHGPPQGRRAFLNAALAQENPIYYAALAQYARALAQKAALLRSESVDTTLLAIYNERLIGSGTRLILARRHYLAALAERATAVYESMAEHPDETFTASYTANIPQADLSEADIAGTFAERLRVAQISEVTRRSCLVGPHRDDVDFRIAGRSLAAYGSQGQRRSAVLALKIAEYGVMAARTGEAPILLLDDMLSELDGERRERFLEQLGRIEQVFVTATEAPRTLVAAQTYRITAAHVEKLAA